jgi:hypothetical protein
VAATDVAESGGQQELVGAAGARGAHRSVGIRERLPASLPGAGAESQQASTEQKQSRRLWDKAFSRENGLTGRAAGVEMKFCVKAEWATRDDAIQGKRRRCR